MPVYTYAAIAQNGKREEGRIEAITLGQAGAFVKQMGLRVVNITEVKSNANVKEKKKRAKHGKVPMGMKIIFFRELATLTGAGIQLVDALQILSVQFKEKQVIKIIDQIAEMVKAGHTFSSALSMYPKLFSPMVVSLVQAAEAGGGLDKILKQIAFYIEYEENTKKKLKSATSYPKFVMGFFGLVLVGVVFGLLPKFKDIFESFGAELPLPTQLILSASNWIQSNILIVIILAGMMAAGFKMFKRTQTGRKLIDQFVFRIPLAGSLLQKYMLTRIARTMAVLLNSGVTLTEALKISGNTADNVYLEGAIENINQEVTQGKSLATEMERYPVLFPNMVTSMITVGEKSGTMSMMLEKIAEFNDEDFTSVVDRLSQVLEPMMMGGLGVIILIIVLALYLPIFQMSGAIH